MYVETLTGVLFWSSDLLGNIFVQFVFHLRPSPDHYYDVVFMFSVELNFRLLGVFLCGWQPADSQAGRPAEDSVVIPSVVVFTSEVLT